MNGRMSFVVELVNFFVMQGDTASEWRRRAAETFALSTLARLDLQLGSAAPYVFSPPAKFLEAQQ